MISAEAVSGAAQSLYSETGAHDWEHAFNTTAYALYLSHQPEYAEILSDHDRFILTVASVGHDIGYAPLPAFKSGTQWEHSPMSAIMLKDQVERVAAAIDPGTPLSEMDRALISMLILNHDKTNESFLAYPFFEKDHLARPLGIERPSGPPPGMISDLPSIIPAEFFDTVPVGKFRTYLEVLQEADGLLGDYQRTMNFSRRRGIPVFVKDQDGFPGMGLPAWQASAAANCYLAALRGLIDAKTAYGREFAWKYLYRETISKLSQLLECECPGSSEHLGVLRRSDVETYIWSKEKQKLPYVEIEQGWPMETLPSLEHMQPLLQMVEKHTAAASFTSRLVPVEHLMFKRTGSAIPAESLVEIRAGLLAHYGIDVATQLDGAMRVLVDTKLPGTAAYRAREYTLIPPVARKPGADAAGLPHYHLLNGIEWMEMARRLDIPKVRVLYIE